MTTQSKRKMTRKIAGEICICKHKRISHTQYFVDWNHNKEDEKCSFCSCEHFKHKKFIFSEDGFPNKLNIQGG